MKLTAADLCPKGDYSAVAETRPNVLNQLWSFLSQIETSIELKGMYSVTVHLTLGLNGCDRPPYRSRIFADETTFLHGNWSPQGIFQQQAAKALDPHTTT